MFIHTGKSGAESKARFWQYISRVMSTDIRGNLCVCFAVAGGFGMVSHSAELGVSTQPLKTPRERDECL